MLQETGEILAGVFRPVAQSRQVGHQPGASRTGRDDARRFQLADDEEVVELALQIFVVVVGDAAHREQVGVAGGANGGDGAGLHVHGQRAGRLAVTFLVFGAQHHFVGGQHFAAINAKPAVGVRQFFVRGEPVGRTPAHVFAVVGAQVEHFGADDDVAVAQLVLQSAAEAGADDEVGPVTFDGHFGGDAGAFLADAEGQQRDRLAGQRAFVKVEVLLAHDMAGVGPS